MQYRLLLSFLPLMSLVGIARSDERIRYIGAQIPAVASAPADGFGSPAYFRTNRYDVWQSYGVNRWGFYRPLVVYTPSGSYYQFDGIEYPFAELHQRTWIRSVGGSPYRDAPAYMPYIEN